MADEELRAKLAASARVLTQKGIFNEYGHISARVPGQDRYYITATLGSTDKELTPEGLVLCDYRGQKLSGNGTVPLEAVLHSALHQARPDAAAINHVHPFYSMALAIAGIPFAPVTMQGVQLGEHLPVYKKAELLINEDHGKKLLRAIGKAKAILLRGHGVVVLGESIEEAAYNTIYLEENCRYILEAARAGVKPLSLTRSEIKERMSQMQQSSQGKNPYKRVFDIMVARAK